jgi:hypothetical protein
VRYRAPIELPPGVLAKAQEIADETGMDLEDVLGDLAAAALPGLLAELADEVVSKAARERLTRPTGTDLVGHLESDNLGPRLVSRSTVPVLPEIAESPALEAGDSTDPIHHDQDPPSIAGGRSYDETDHAVEA